MKAIVTSLGMIVFVAAVVVGGTGAFFSDSETSEANVFTAGALDLTIDSVAHINGLVCFGDQWIPETIVNWDDDELVLIGDPNVAIPAYNAANPANVPQAGTACAGTWTLTDLGPSHQFFDYGDLKPGDYGENTISLHVNNNDAYLCAIVNNVESDDNLLTEPEGEDGDSTPGPQGEGELHEALRFFIWEDNGDNIFNSESESEGVLVENGTLDDEGGIFSLYNPVNGVFEGGTTQYLGVAWCYGTFNGDGSCNGVNVDNTTQTDSLQADLTFYIEQARNNPNFTCPSLNQDA